MSRFVPIALAMLVGCAGVASRFPADVQTAVAHDDMRRLETERFIIYYPAHRRAEVDRFLVRADRCAQTLRDHALMKDLAKIVIVMPDAPFNNAFVAPDVAGYEEISVVPAYSTLDFTTEFGLPPDPGAIACHELVHYVHFQQTAGFWGTFNKLFGPMYTPQIGYDPWMDEGIATHYEARLSPGLGRPVWPIFTGMFAAAYAGRHVSGGELSSYGRMAPVGHHYLVGSMFIRFLVERYGERPLWNTIENQSHAFTGWFFTGTFKHGFAVSFGDLLDQFADWVKQTFPVRERPPTQQRLAKIGNDARYARGRDGTEAWIAEDVDSPPRLTVRDAQGTTLLETAVVEIVPPRALMLGDPLLMSGLSITADGREVWLTAIDLGPTYQVTRLMRWRRGERGLTEVARALGPGATIDPTGTTYYYCAVDGDRWSLAAYDVHTGARRTVVDMKPGTYIVGAQPSPDGKQLAASVFDGTTFAVWVIDAATGAVTRRIGAPGAIAFDPSFTADGRLMWLAVVDARFQVFVEGVQASDAPYAVLAAREANGTIRFLDRERWSWELGEVALPARPAAAPPAPAAAPPADAQQPPAEQPPLGQPPAGQPPAGQPPAGQPPAGQPPAEQPPLGQPPVGQPPAGQPPVGQPPAGQPPVGQPPAGQPTAGQPPAGQPTAGQPPVGQPPVGQPPVGQPPVGQPPERPVNVAATLYPAIPLQTPPSTSVLVQSDESYSAFDHLFFPQVRSPTLLFMGPVPHIGLVLGGADRLELQRWSLAGYVQPGTSGEPAHYGANATYQNNMLAPAYVLAQGSFLDWVSKVADEVDPMTTYKEQHRTRDASLAIGGTYRGTLAATAGGVYTDDYVQLEGNLGSRVHVGGPSVTLQWLSAETTRYTGLRRAILVEGQAAYYPEQWSTFMGDITDVAGTFGLSVPVPIGRRHTLSGFVRGRTLIAPNDTGLLQVGGDSALGFLWQGSNKPMPGEFDTSRFPPNLRFVEPLRGYEDYAITSDKVVLGEVAWKYPLIIDRGNVNTWFLPACYLRQIDLELFGSGAITDGDDHHFAAGGALTLRIQFLRIPLAIMYQIAQRLRDDKAITQFVGIGPDL